MTPSEMVVKYGVDDPDVKKRINDINNGVSYTASSRDLSSEFSNNYYLIEDQSSKYIDEYYVNQNLSLGKRQLQIETLVF